jgi:DNA invertase Pin-like site-specific DNA recombinase
MADNQHDMALKGRAASGDRNGSRLHPERLRHGPGVPHYGESNGQARLTEAAVREMRTLSLSTAETASRFGISRTEAWRVLTGRRWPHV